MNKVAWESAYGGAIHVGEGERLWLYTDFHGHFAYARNAREFYKLTGVSEKIRTAIRVVSRDVPMPEGFRRVGEGLAFDGIKRKGAQ